LPAEVTTISELIAYLRRRASGYGEVFENPEKIRVAVNQEHASFDSNICDSDEIAFFPPVTGG
jgi:sulfur-carrier protein